MNDCYGVIYCIRNTIKNKQYIGQHVNGTNYSLEDRIKSHKSPSSGCRYIRNSIQYHGWENFTYSIIYYCTDGGQERLDELEIFFIEEYKTLCPLGYNLTKGGNGVRACDKTKQKMSESQKKHWSSPENRQRQSDRSAKYWSNPQAREIMSEIKKKYYVDNPNALERMSETKKQYYIDNPQAREEYGNKMKVIWASPELRQRQSETTTKYFENPENRQKQSETTKAYIENNPDIIDDFCERMKIYWSSPEARQKQSEVATNYFAIPENRQKQSDNTTNYFANPENRQKQSEKLKKFFETNPSPTNKKVYQYSKDGKTFIKEWISIADAKRTLNVRNISQVCKGNRPVAGGFVWKYTRV